MARPQVNTNIGQPEGVRVAARPTNDAAPVYTAKQSKGAALAQSLISLAPTLQGYVQDLQQDYQMTEANRATDEIGGMTYAEAQEAVASGRLRDTESPWYQAAFEQQFGQVHAQQRKREMMDAYNNSFDKHNGDIDQFLAEFAGADMERFGGSEFIMSGYRSEMQGVLSQFRDTHAEWKSQWTRDQVTTNFETSVYNRAGSDFGSLLDKDEQMKHMLKFGSTEQEVATSLMSVLKRTATEGDLDKFMRIANARRFNAAGEELPSLMDTPDYADTVIDLMNAADNAQKTNRRNNRGNLLVDMKALARAGELDQAAADAAFADGSIRQSEYEELLRTHSEAVKKQRQIAHVEQVTGSYQDAAIEAVTSGNGFALQDVILPTANGGTTTLSGADQRQQAFDAVMGNMVANQTDVGTMAHEMASWGLTNTYEPWENLLSGAHLMLTNAGSTGEGGKTEVPDQAIQAYALWKGMMETPGVRNLHTSQEADNVWRTAFLLESTGSLSPDEALRQAAMPPTEQGTAAANNFSRDEFEEMEAAYKARKQYNTGAANSTTEALAKFFISRGVGRKAAVEQAIEAYQQSHTVINGVYIPTNDLNLPDNFEEASMSLLQKFADQSDGEFDVDDLTLVPSHRGSSTWNIVMKSNVALPVGVGGIPNSALLGESRDLKNAVSDEIRMNAQLSAIEVQEKQAWIQQRASDYEQCLADGGSRRECSIKYGGVNNEHHWAVHWREREKQLRSHLSAPGTAAVQ